MPLCSRQRQLFQAVGLAAELAEPDAVRLFLYEDGTTGRAARRGALRNLAIEEVLREGGLQPLCCPLLRAPAPDPVALVAAGHAYGVQYRFSRAALTQWLLQQPHHPLTGVPLPDRVCLHGDRLAQRLIRARSRQRLGRPPAVVPALTELVLRKPAATSPWQAFWLPWGWRTTLVVVPLGLGVLVGLAAAHWRWQG